MGMAEEHGGRLSEHAVHEVAHGLFVHLERIEVEVDAFQEALAKASPPVVADLGVSPNGGDSFTQSPSGPLIGTKRCPTQELLARFVVIGCNRDAGGTGRRVFVQRLLVDSLDEQPVSVAAKIGLRQERHLL